MLPGLKELKRLPVETMLTKKVLMRQYVLQADAHPFVAGAVFKDAWKTRVRTTILGEDVNVPSLDTMISMKTAAGRTRDKEDLAVLRHIRKQSLKKEA